MRISRGIHSILNHGWLIVKNMIKNKIDFIDADAMIFWSVNKLEMILSLHIGFYIIKEVNLLSR